MTSPHQLSFDLPAAMAELAQRDPQLASVMETTLQFQLDEVVAASPYDALLESIAYQSISGKAAATIFARVKALSSNGENPTPQEMLRIKKTALRKTGLSGAKVLAMKDLAQKTIDGVVPTLEEAQKLSDDELVQRLVSVRGIGAWTVEMFLIFRLGRPDVLPIHDLAVKKGWSVIYKKKYMPTPKQLLAFGERWRPYRTVASWHLWRAFERAGHTVTRKIRAAKPKRKTAAKTKSRTRVSPSKTKKRQRKSR